MRAALNFAVHWINDYRPELGTFALKVQDIQPGDHYGAVLSSMLLLRKHLIPSLLACKLLEKERIFGLFAPTENTLSLQLNRLTDAVGSYQHD